MLQNVSVYSYLRLKPDEIDVYLFIYLFIYLFREVFLKVY